MFTLLSNIIPFSEKMYIASLPSGGPGWASFPLFINWNPDLVICHLGPVVIRWYSTLWIIGLLFAYLIVRHLYKVQKIEDAKFDPLFV